MLSFPMISPRPALPRPTSSSSLSSFREISSSFLNLHAAAREPRASLVISCPSAPAVSCQLSAVSTRTALHPRPISTRRIGTHAARSHNSFRIHISEKCARNSFRMCTSQTKDLKPPRMNTSEKTGGGGALVAQASACALTRRSRGPLLPCALLTTHYSLLSRTILP